MALDIRTSHYFYLLVNAYVLVAKLLISRVFFVAEKEIPKELWDCGSGIRVLDISENFIKEVPARISSFRSMQVRYA